MDTDKATNPPRTRLGLWPGGVALIGSVLIVAALALNAQTSTPPALQNVQVVSAK